MLIQAVAASLQSMVIIVGLAASPAAAQSGLLATKPIATRAGDINFINFESEAKRRRVPKQYRDLARGVGYLVNHRSRRRKLFCTAFCVGDDLIASNAHCLESDGKRKRQYNLRSMVFHLKGQGRRTKRSKLAWNRIGRRGEPRLSLLADNPTADPQEAWHFRDWAVARLRKKVCAGHVLQFADEDLLRTWPWVPTQRFFMIGYNGGLKKRRKWRSYNRCRFSERYIHNNRRIGWHGCYGVSGSSGSPIFVETGYGPRVVAINHLLIRRRKLRKSKKKKVLPFPNWVTNAAVIPNQLIERLHRFSTARYFKKSTSLVKFQKRLKAAGYFEGKTGSRYVARTREAIFRLEAARGLTPLGIPTQELLENLNQLQR